MRRFWVFAYVLLICVIIALAARLTYFRFRLIQLEQSHELQDARLADLEDALAGLQQAQVAPVVPVPVTSASPPVTDDPGASEPEPSAAADPESDAPTEEDVRFYIATGFEEYFPNITLSEQNVEDASGAIVRMRTHREAMRALKLTSGNVEELRAHRAALHKSWDDFERATGVSMSRFLATVMVKGEPTNDAADDEPVFEYMSDFQP